MAKSTSVENFWEKVEKTDGCWLWTANHGKYGHGLMKHAGQQWLAHRFAWTLANGPIPDGLFVCHRCDTPACVRPSHLFLGTPEDNSRDMVEKGRSARGERNPAARLSEDDVRFIRRRYAEGGISQPALGRMFSVSHRAIGHIIHRRNWPHVV